MAEGRARLRARALATTVLVSTALATTLLAGCAGGAANGDGVVSGVHRSDTDGWNGAVLDAPYTLADVTLTDSEGDRARLRERLAAGQDLTLVFLGYTNCPDICRAVMADLASTRARLGADAGRVAVWFVTTDPARDDPRTLRSYLDRFDPSFEGWTGPLGRLLTVARSVHVPVERGPRLPSGGYDVTHGTPVLGVTPAGKVRVVWTEGTSPARITQDVTRLLAEG